MRLLDTIESFIAGDWGKEEPNEDETMQVHCLRSADIDPIYHFDYSGVPYRFVTLKSYQVRKLQEGDIVIEKSGGTDTCSTGRPIYISKELLQENEPLMCSNFCTAIRIRKEWNPIYIYFLLRYIHHSGIFANFEGKTSGIHNLDMECAYSAIELSEVSYNEQTRVANILSSLDAKIALNRRMNEELEGMAKMLYDYWFVQFDFPNEEGKPYKSSGGAMEYNAVLKREIPAGWKVKSISDICDVVNGATPSTRDALNFDGNVVWITPKDLSVQKEKFIFKGERNITQQGYDSCNTTIVPQGAILMSSRAPIGLMSIAGNVLCTNQGFKTLVPKNMNDRYYMWYYLQMMMPQIKSLGGGTTFKEVSKDSLLPFPIVNIDCPRVKKNWIETVSPIFKKQSLIVQEVAKLTALRDKLLPLLMNGQVRVAD